MRISLFFLSLFLPLVPFTHHVQGETPCRLRHLLEKKFKSLYASIPAHARACPKPPNSLALSNEKESEKDDWERCNHSSLPFRHSLSQQRQHHPPADQTLDIGLIALSSPILIPNCPTATDGLTGAGGFPFASFAQLFSSLPAAASADPSTLNPSPT